MSMGPRGRYLSMFVPDTLIDDETSRNAGEQGTEYEPRHRGAYFGMWNGENCHWQLGWRGRKLHWNAELLDLILCPGSNPINQGRIRMGEFEIG
ncbi:uncharacterized protein PADG_11484 [Paracoccidioides brasiliensis Pb18]|uniref:Uncharacterized protein n=1 Tax=Paracoccidioides brasiliensis (strain Pb18) TaxID=502780 RepID=A0A0A0HVD0_PARBD|nr:uncharacterized protein PADG_11484 [Paracoccidioides brasiliensis Pb18]KGM92293.1 hypothetical protein PADG_11484 [Paracoccidioides brasiliensis Pb18]ODH51148.1 hypothetical protein GX48_02763 [Paracoccidioides brasiliensis]